MAPQDAVIQVGELPPKNNPPNDLVAGYPRLAGQLGKLPQLGIYRRFGALNARSILYLQAELTCLEKDLVAVEQDDENSNEDLRSDFCGNWADLSGYSSNGEKPSSQWKLVLEIRKKLKEYDEALIRQHTIISMEQPSPEDLEHIQCYLETNEMGPQILSGEDRETWGSIGSHPEQAADLITLHPPRQEDAFSRWFMRNAIRKYFVRSWFHHKRKASKEFGMVIYRESTLLRITNFITSIVASMFPIASTTILWVVTSPGARLGIIATFNLVLSICLAGFTKASRAEIFAVTATFAAVQVVFVGSAVGKVPVATETAPT